MLMHTTSHTRAKGALIPVRHTIKRNGAYYYNRRVPERAVEACGAFVRVRLSSDPTEAMQLSERLTESLNAIWKHDQIEHGIDLRILLQAARPKSFTLGQLSDEYLSLRSIDPAPLRQAVTALIAVAGDKDIKEYDRQDARALVAHLRGRGNSTGTIRRRIGPLSALLNFGFSELDIEKRNPFGRLMIQGEGDDRGAKETFTTEELERGYRLAFASGSEIKLLMPILGETGCRIGEIVGLRLEDIELDNELVRIVPHEGRRLKTRGSEREIPLVGPALLAMKMVAGERSKGYLFPRYLKGKRIRATHASNAVNKWMKREFQGRTAHCLRHTFRDRLRAVECPMELIDQLGGWSSIGTVGAGYGRGYDLGAKRKWLAEVALDELADPRGAHRASGCLPR